MDIVTKVCGRCRVVKPVEKFYKNKSTKTGYTSYCKPCATTDRKKRDKADPSRLVKARVRAQQHKGIKNHLTRRAFPLAPDGWQFCTECKHLLPYACFGVTKAKTKTGLNGVCKECAAKRARESYNRRKGTPGFKARAKAYREANKEKIAADLKVYQAKNKKAYRRYKLANKAKRREAEGSFTGADIKAQRERQQNKCYWCGEVLTDNYHIDHIIPLSRGGTHWPDNICCACPSCNLRKWAKMPEEFLSELYA